MPCSLLTLSPAPCNYFNCLMGKIFMDLGALCDPGPGQCDHSTSLLPCPGTDIFYLVPFASHCVFFKRWNRSCVLSIFIWIFVWDLYDRRPVVVYIEMPPAFMFTQWKEHIPNCSPRLYFFWSHNKKYKKWPTRFPSKHSKTLKASLSYTALKRLFSDKLLHYKPGF